VVSQSARILIGMEPVPIVYAYLPAPMPAHGPATVVGGGALIGVSARAAAAIRAHRDPETGRLGPEVRRLLHALDDREAHATELGLLVRALARRSVYVRDLPAPP
jgi:hypothetical protein